MLPTFRVREVPVSEYPGKACYLVWTPESWAGPHMVHGYGDGRYYRRGQYRAIVMSERDVEDRYPRCLQLVSSYQDFIDSERAKQMRQLY